MKRFFRVALLGLEMLTVMLLAAAVTLRVALHGHEVTVPDFAGMTVAEASQTALRTGVGLNLESRFYSTTEPAGRILSQTPAAGTTVRHGWQVRVTESLGPQQVTIPDVVGDPVQQASMDLRKNHLDLGTLAHIGAPGDPEMTLAQTPQPNAGVDQPVVNLLLSSIPNNQKAFVMPSFVGMKNGTAREWATMLGLKVVTVASAPSGAPTASGKVAAGAVPSPNIAPDGLVTEQSPESGFKAAPGDGVRLILQMPTAMPASLSLGPAKATP
ncbi:MAG: PASTA domain-containing protein [Acidobacteriaceae bacterium]